MDIKDLIQKGDKSTSYVPSSIVFILLSYYFFNIAVVALNIKNKLIINKKSECRKKKE